MPFCYGRAREGGFALGKMREPERVRWAIYIVARWVVWNPEWQGEGAVKRLLKSGQRL